MSWRHGSINGGAPMKPIVKAWETYKFYGGGALQRKYQIALRKDGVVTQRTYEERYNANDHLHGWFTRWRHLGDSPATETGMRVLMFSDEWLAKTAEHFKSMGFSDLEEIPTEWAKAR